MTKIVARTRLVTLDVQPRIAQRQHKYAVGQAVMLRWPANVARPKGVNANTATAFEVTRLLPEQGDFFHYRVKNAATGQERVVAEIDLRTEAE